MLSEIISKTAPRALSWLFPGKFSLPKIVAIPLLALALLSVSFYFFFLNKVYPGVYVSGVEVSGLTRDEAVLKLESLETPEKLEIKSGEQDFSLNLKTLDATFSAEQSADAAIFFGREQDFKKGWKNISIALFRGANLPAAFTFDNEKLTAYLDSVARELNIPYAESEVIIEKGKVVVNTGNDGQEVDRVELRHKIIDAIAYSKEGKIEIPLEEKTQQLTQEDLEYLKTRAQKLVGKRIKLTFEFESFVYPDSDLVWFLKPQGKEVNLLKEKAQDIISDISESVNREPQNARFVFEESRVKEFEPAKDGVAVEKEQLLERIENAIASLETGDQKEVVVEIPIFATKPTVDNAEVNDLGIRELIGRGESYYRGSIPSRVHNLSLAASRLNGILIKPGEEFSFNKAVGEISTLTGYQQAYVIKEGRTILDDGGGVCQTSTTFFRAALSSGLPILERHQHSYRVSYYEQGTKAGIDAAIYQPGVDLKFKNDTPSHILIQAKNDTSKSRLVFEFYGTSDGRIAEIGEPRHWDAKPAPPPLYQDDPTLPVGQEKQIEKPVPGLKTSFTYKVTRNGEILQNKTFYSNYRAWQAVFLRGTMGQ